MVFNLELVLIFLIGFWGTTLTVLVWQLKRHYNKLIKRTDKKTLTEILAKILNEIALTDKKISELAQKIEEVDKSGFSHLQKVGLVRFNPFEEVGSDQSFVICLLDAFNNGIVLTSLTSRSGTRWYGKTIKKGEGVEHDFSKEEKEALRQAQSKH